MAHVSLLFYNLFCELPTSINSLSSGRGGWKLWCVIFEHIISSDIINISYKMTYLNDKKPLPESVLACAIVLFSLSELISYTICPTNIIHCFIFNSNLFTNIYRYKGSNDFFHQTPKYLWAYNEGINACFLSYCDGVEPEYSRWKRLVP